MQDLAAMDDLKYISHDILSKTINSFWINCLSQGFELGTS